MYNKFQLDTWLKDVGKEVGKPVKIYMIGGGALSFKKLKDATKDIDIIVISKEDCNTLDKAIKKAGFTLETELEDEFYLTALAVYVKDDESRIDVFLKQVGKMLMLSDKMLRRSNFYQSYGMLDVHLVSNEDIFLFKSMSSRPGDIEDSNRLVMEGIDFDVIYDEIVEQSKAGRRWFFWFYENLCKLENFSGAVVPIKGKVFSLVKTYWKERPDDFMNEIIDLSTHIPDKKLLKELTKIP